MKAYELSLRRPSRRSLVALLDALKADLHTRTMVLSDTGFSPDRQTPAVRLSNPWFTKRLLNWEEALTEVLSMLKGHYGGDGAVTGENPYFGAAMEHFLAGDSSHVQRYLAIWEGVEPRRRKFRFSYPVICKHSVVGPLNFQVQVNPADALGSIIFCDWVPVDSETWSRLEHVGG